MLEQQRQILDIQNKLERLEKMDIGFPKGTSFPTVNIGNGTFFFRTDLGFLCYYDLANTRWLTVEEWCCTVTISTTVTLTFTGTTAAVRRGSIRSTHVPVFTRAQVITTLAAGTSNGANFWTVAFVATTSGTTIWSFTTAADSAAATSTHVTSTMTAQSGVTETILRMDLTESGAPPDITPVLSEFWYRLIIT